MEITIGVQHVTREITLDSDQTAEEVSAAVATAIDEAGILELVDSRGRKVLVPASVIAFVEIGAEARGRVGFGTL